MPHKRKKRTLAQVHRAIKQAWGRLEKSPAYRIGEHAKLKSKIRELEREEASILRIPLLPGRG
jgi:hypothetical protein